ncbi:hypothetical protein PIB30_034124 [Stylosanthes scabra]|uniref:Protein TIC 214 n=1 Tax=Stylosanthes scabra TaxID=79078 RepID=A0ABU6TDS2_9FABA|nr:hypothetical protein [Stylosanthes scabra]
MKEYDMFFMKESENINEMFERFSTIINNLDAMGKGTLRRPYQKNSKKITYDELRGKLLANELTYRNNDSKKKTIALKSRVSREEDKEEEENDMSDDELALFARRLRRMMKFRRKWKESSSKDNKKEQNKIIYYNCRESGHYKSDFPQKKKEENYKKDKKKVLMASWEDLENDSDDEDSNQEAQLYLMANSSEFKEVHATNTLYYYLICKSTPLFFFPSASHRETVVYLKNKK